MEISELKKEYENNSHIISKPIYDLLSQTENFNRATLLDAFKQIRDASASKDDLISILNTMAKAIHEAGTFRDSLSDDEAKEVVSDAISYCNEVVLHRLNELHEHHDQIYDLYMKEKK